ncbi:MAG: choice-of-anchor L domain-containing protein [Flavobacteriales bacterium]|nr:choice-of-anchor L domain-containing protein [Flavobacteriales bacterium]MBK6944788.1 choice-of-anchor L domain-containing protein [Flavobacteriales bacterium]MBK7241063.1 choice-of-anchor L domain-containing protein [Flavobacteriales bacterium]MBK9534445.1 choice-of-anchor L domain-containing protein [Flavobacteriales bacterium]MBP9139228.1 choice-of-anchor L domain-containing protein [Flavobacteriales bacterium]
MYKSLTSVAITFLFAFQVNGQLVVDGTPSPTQLIQDVLLGGGVTASNITYAGDAAARASFTASGSNLGLDAGVILSTGTATDAAGSGIDFASGGSGTAGDQDLEDLSGQIISDAAILEFDFIPTGDTLRFRYVFGSEEYPEYVCDIFNDAFGFFLSGPGINGPFSNNAKNIALIPSTTVPITINTVNSGSPGGFNDATTCASADPNWVNNSIYYVDNGTGTTVVYDGFTTVLTAFSLVECGQLYHIKLAIGDGGDSSFDSAVFLEAGSFTSAGEVTATLTGGTGLNGTDLVEGCGPWDFVFTRVGELDQDVTIDLAVSGTSTAGVDYMPLFPTQINFPANVDQVTISIDASLDMDGDETLIMDVEQLLQCANVVVQSQFIFNIVSHPELDVQLTDVNSVCNQQNTLTPTVTGGTGVYSYLWNTGETTASINVTPGVTTSYDVTVSEACGVDPVTETVTVTLPIYDPLDIDVSPATEIVCLEDGDISVLSATGGDGDFTYEWTANGAVVGATATIQVPGGPPQWYFVTVSEGCGTSTMDSVLVSAVVNEPIVITTSPDLTVLCAGDTALLQVIDITGGGGIYTLIWEDPNGVQLSTAYDLTVGVPADQTYTITATDQCETEGTATVSTSIPQYAPLQLTMPADMRLCAGDSVALVPSISGASGYYYITWADLDITDPVFTVMPNEQTVYTMTVRDECGEELTDNVTIEVEHVQIDIVTTNHGQDDWHVEAATVPYAQTWVWDMGDGTRSRGFEAFHSYMDLDEHMVTLEITTPNGCAATDSVLLRPPGHIYFANAFTPDGDGINDIWGPKGHYIEQFELTIFDRWGSQVFSTKEMDITWDGTINGGGKAPTGVYVYKYRAEGHLFPSTEGYGHVTLLAGSQN